MPRRRFRVLALVLAALFVSGLAAGCKATPVNKAARKPKERIPVIKAEATAIPKDWPKEIPTYPNAELLEASTTATGKILTFKTKDSAVEIFEWYYDTLEAAKWNIKGPTMDVAQNVVIIKSELGPLTFLLDGHSRQNEKGEIEGSTITLTSPAPKIGGP